MRDLELITNPDGSILVRYSDGRCLTVSDDGGQGYDFALRYLGHMAQGYRNHLRAADCLLQRQMTPTEYRALRADERAYNAHLAVQSMHCIFGAFDNIPDCDNMGNLNVEFVPCPCRGVCPYNGYKHRDKAIVCCNPIYELPLTRRQLEVADLLVNTSYAVDDIATALSITAKCVKNHATAIYATLGVANRQELTLLLRNKRIV